MFVTLTLKQIRMDNFELLHTIQAYGKIPISEYRSKNTGLTVFIVETDGPINSVLLALANETFDEDASIPTILERLMYMGSQEYPYKDFLTTLSNQCLLSRPYPFTVIDHTSFNFEAVGSEGFLTILPVFLDHILFPELSEASYITEIHHITQDGEDDGVLYREIAEFENSAETLLDLAVRKHIYPGRCGYSVPYRGEMKTLRESMNIDKVRQFHKKYYQPDNLKIILFGTVEHKAVFKSLEKIEKKIISQFVTLTLKQIRMDNFELLHTIQAYGKIPISEYRSKNTGLTVFIVETDGPINSVLLALANETFDEDASIPTILERLMYMGSQEYPYKDFLTTLSNQCLLSRPYPFTVIDHTSFNFEAVGSEGFLTILPVFLDHILFPELSEASYITEIHHITQDGEDDGVLYREIAEFENSAETLLDLAVRKHIYPGRCGYSVPYRGEMKTLRESMNIDKVRQFHKKYYQPDNLKIILFGTVEHKAVFKSLEKIEKKIISQSERRTFQRLWQNSIPPMTEDVKDLTIFYPSDKETTGKFCIAWRGPSSVTELYYQLATSILLKYLTDLPFSSMKREFVTDEPYAKYVWSFLQEGVESCITINFDEVPLNKMSEIKSKLQTLFKKILSDKNIDMEDLKSVINKDKLERLSDLESSPSDHLGPKIIRHMLYGNTKDNFQQRLNPLEDITRLLKEPQSFWLNLLQKYFIENKYVVIQCLPSKEENMRIESIEIERTAVQKQNLTDEQLKEKGTILKKAIEYNERKFPPDLLQSFPIPILDSIKLRNVYRYSSEKYDKGRIDLSVTPVFTYFDDIKTNFTYMYAILDTHNIPRELVNYLHLLKEIIFELPIKQEECLVHHEDVMKKLENDTVFTRSLLYNFGFKFVLHLKVEDSKYDNGVRWLSKLLYNTVLTTERLKVAVTRIMDSLGGIKCYKCYGYNIHDVMDEMCYPKNSRAKNSPLYKIKFLSEVITKLETDNGTSEILQNINNLKNIITRPSNVSLYFAGNLDNLKNPTKAINEFLPAYLHHAKSQQRITPRPAYTFSDFSNPINGCVVGHPVLKGSVFSQQIKSLTSYDHPDYIALELYLKYLSKLKNDTWETYIRKGIINGFSIQINVDHGILSLYFSIKGGDVAEVYTVLKEMIINQTVSRKLNTTLLESVRGLSIFENIYEENSVPDIVRKSLFSYMNNYDFEKHRNNVKLLHKVTIEDLNRVGEQYVAPLFDPTKTKTAVVTDSKKIEEVAKKFKQLGFEMEAYSSIESLIN